MLSLRLAQELPELSRATPHCATATAAHRFASSSNMLSGMSNSTLHLTSTCQENSRSISKTTEHQNTRIPPTYFRVAKPQFVRKIEFNSCNYLEANSRDSGKFRLFLMRGAGLLFSSPVAGKICRIGTQMFDIRRDRVNQKFNQGQVCMVSQQAERFHDGHGRVWRSHMESDSSIRDFAGGLTQIDLHTGTLP